MTFVEACFAGVSAPHDVADWIRVWHADQGSKSLQEFLGLTFEEYKTFAEDPSELANIIERKRRATMEDDRPSFDEIYMGMAFMLARRSTCLRKSGVDGHPMRVGCVITTADRRRVIAIGYNGNASGLPNRCDDPDVPGACGDLHAEENATISCTEPRATDKVVYSTHLPCVMCAKRIIQLGGVKKVFYAKPYRITRSLELFDAVGIEHAQLDVGCGWDEPMMLIPTPDRTDANTAALVRSSNALIPWRRSASDFATDVLGLGEEAAEKILTALSDKLRKNVSPR